MNQHSHQDKVRRLEQIIEQTFPVTNKWSNYDTAGYENKHYNTSENERFFVIDIFYYLCEKVIGKQRAATAPGTPSPGVRISE